MKIIITAGKTTERIDPVRKITNSATGRLGSLIAEEFAGQGKDRMDQIYYICEKGTIVPELNCLETVTVEGVSGVKDKLTELLTSYEIDAVIHTMAVSDYTVDRLTTEEGLSEFLAGRLSSVNKHNNQVFLSEPLLAEFIRSCIKENDRLLDNRNKVGSNIDNLILSMKQTPKLIGLIKALQPSTILVGFKLLKDVEKEVLIDTGYELLLKNNCDLVLANDLMDIRGDSHTGLLIAPDKSYTSYGTKSEIAYGIVKEVMKLIKKRGNQP